MSLRQVTDSFDLYSVTLRGNSVGWSDEASVAATGIANKKGILAADETVATLTKRLNSLGFQSSEETQRPCRQMLFTAASA
jgi:fructose-bisphosphate aldolase class 1